jgi:hypothetical protein
MTELYFTSENGFVAVHMKTAESVNAWQGKVLLPGVNGALVTTEGGVSALWQTSPHYENGAIIFSGGAPGGLEGDNVLFRFAPSEAAKAAYSADTRVYLNDGQGTEVKPKTGVFSAAAASKTALAADTTPPESFALTLYRSKDLFNGAPVVIFGAEDRGSGVEGYEAKEYTTHGEGSWHAAQSPYLVNPDVRRIEIKAIDYAGNVRAESIRIVPAWWKATGALFVAIFAIAIGYTIYVRWKRHR